MSGIDEIKARLAAAPGDWRVSETPGLNKTVVDANGCVVAVAGRVEDARDIAQAHADRVALLAEVEMLTAFLEESQSQARRLLGMLNERIGEVARLTQERDDARDDATRFRHELKLAEGCLLKPHIDRDVIIAGLRLAQNRETGTWTIPAEKLRGEP